MISIPPKMAAQLAQRARNGEGVRLTERSDIYEFVAGQSNVVTTLIGLDCPTGYSKKDPTRAAELRAILDSRKEPTT